jgi:SAM-dependent methyltransferase
MLAAADNLITIALLSIVLIIVAAIGYGFQRDRSKRKETVPDPSPPTSAPPLVAPVAARLHPDAVLALRNEAELQDTYKQLRERPNLVRVQAIWAAQYKAIDITEYFREERTFLAENPSVEFERIVVGQDHHRPYLQELATNHQNLLIYTSSTSLQFELYLCEYSDPTRHLVGVLVVNSALSRLPEFGVLLDGRIDGELTQFGYTLRQWFESIPKELVAGSLRAQNVWTQNAPDYDRFVSRNSELDFLKDYIRQEDTLLESLVKSASRDVTVLEFGSGTGRTLQYLASVAELEPKIRLLIGIDHSSGMLEVARNKRDKTRSSERDRLFYFELDGARARAFWEDQVRLRPSMNDQAQLARAGFATTTYENTDKIVCCLLNTLGVMDAATRDATVENIFSAATPNDRIAISVFDRAAFPQFARILYPFIKTLVGQERISSEAYSDELAEFRAGYYYSHWFDLDEIETFVEASGGEIVSVESITSDGTTIGHFVVARVATG